MLAAPSFLGALPVQGGVGFDMDSLVGLVIVFFAVIWPVIRGLLNVAKSNRQDFQARSGAGSASDRPSGLEAFLEGLREDDSEDDKYHEADRVVRAAERARRRREQREEELAAQRVRREQAMAAAPSDPFEASGREQAAEARIQETPREAPSRLSSTASAASSRGGRSAEPMEGLGGAREDGLEEIPSEDALEADLFARPENGRGDGPEREPDEEGLEVIAGAGERAAFALDAEQRSPLDRIQAGRSPWRSAILMKEILGPPISVTPHDDQLL
jgi:hypothetical protein